MPHLDKTVELTPLGLTIKNLAEIGNADIDVDLKNLITIVVKKTILGNQKDHKIDVVIKKSTIERLGGIQYVVDSNSLYDTIPRKNLLELITVRDRKLLEDLGANSVIARVTNKSLNSAMKHLYSEVDRDSSKLSLFLSIR